MALQLNELNSDRRMIESEMREQAFKDLDELGLSEEQLPAGLCIYSESWHQDANHSTIRKFFKRMEQGKKKHSHTF